MARADGDAGGGKEGRDRRGAGRDDKQSSVSGPRSFVRPQSQVPSPNSPAGDKKAALKEQALADSGIQTMLEVFPAEIRDVEEIEK